MCYHVLLAIRRTRHRRIRKTAPLSRNNFESDDEFGSAFTNNVDVSELALDRRPAGLEVQKGGSSFSAQRSADSRPRDPGVVPEASGVASRRALPTAPQATLKVVYIGERSRTEVAEKRLGLRQRGVGSLGRSQCSGVVPCLRVPWLHEAATSITDRNPHVQMESSGPSNASYVRAASNVA